MLTTKIFKLADQSYKTAIKITAILGTISFVLGILSSYFKNLSLIVMITQWVVVSILLALWMVKSFYQLDWGKALLVWLVWFVLYIILFIIIVFVFASVIIGLMFAGKIPISPT